MCLFLRRRRRPAFTLIEMLVVVVILGVALAIALPLYASSQKDAKLKACKANMVALQQAEEAYRVRNRSYVSSTDTTNWPKIKEQMGGVPRCPTNDSEYVAVGGTTTLHIKCAGTHTTNPHLLAPVGTAVTSANSATITGVAGDPCVDPGSPDTTQPEFKVGGVQ